MMRKNIARKNDDSWTKLCKRMFDKSPDGRDVIIINDSNAVGGLGHEAVIIGNEKDGWYYYPYGPQVSGLSYTKHYYMGSQRISSKMGAGQSVGALNCTASFSPMSSGTGYSNENTVASSKLSNINYASAILLQNNGLVPPQSFWGYGNYYGNCVSSYAGPDERAGEYWYHPDHLGSSSYVSDINGEVTQNIEYFPSGEVFVENHKNSYNTPYLFNAKEADFETGYYYYGARYYNPRVSLWLNVDPLADYNPFYNSEHYINGQHNGGVYNSGNLNPYIYCYQRPVIFVDPNGKQVFFIHGTTSSSTRWNNKSVNTLMKIANSKYYNRGFNWNAPIYNNEKMRNTAARQLADYVIKNRIEGEEITLVGHSHGSNVNVQAAKLIYEKTGQKVNLLTIAAPAYNKKGDAENPDTQKAYINDHINIWNKIDTVSGDLAGDDYYKNSTSTNVEINVDKYYSREVGVGSGKHKIYDGMGAHSFDVEHPETIDQAIKAGKIRKLKPVEK